MANYSTILEQKFGNPLQVSGAMKQNLGNLNKPVISHPQLRVWNFPANPPNLVASGEATGPGKFWDYLSAGPMSFLHNLFPPSAEEVTRINNQIQHNTQHGQFNRSIGYMPGVDPAAKLDHLSKGIQSNNLSGFNLKMLFLSTLIVLPFFL
jgi:hypothetical protein